MMFAAPYWLTEGATIAGATIAIVSAVALAGRMLRRIPIVDRFHHWIVEGWRRDREDRIVSVMVERIPPVLDETLAFNGTGSFRSDMRIFYATVNDFMAESRADRQTLHDQIDDITQGEQHT